IQPSFLFFSFDDDDAFSHLGSYLHSNVRSFVKSEPDNQKSYHDISFFKLGAVSRFSEAFMGGGSSSAMLRRAAAFCGLISL
ncbi:unnamed protein product, partial [Brassica rapa subsp. trilocularis]